MGGGAGGGEIVEQGAALLATGGRDRQEPGDEEVAGVALGAEAARAPEDGRAECPLGGVGGGRDAAAVGEGPACRPGIEQGAADRTGGSSTTWTRSSAGSSACPATGNAAPHPRHASGVTATCRSIRSASSSARWRPGCPSCPPRRRGSPSRSTGGGGARRCACVSGDSLDGGRDDVPESCRSRASSAAIYSRTGSGAWASNSSDGRDSPLTPPVYRTTRSPSTRPGGPERLRRAHRANPCTPICNAMVYRYGARCNR